MAAGAQGLADRVQVVITQAADGNWVLTDPAYPDRSVMLRPLPNSKGYYSELRIGTLRHEAHGMNRVWTKYIGDVDLLMALAFAQDHITYKTRGERWASEGT